MTSTSATQEADAADAAVLAFLARDFENHDSQSARDLAFPEEEATPAPATVATSSSEGLDSVPAATTDEANAIEEAFADFDAVPLDEALLEDLVVALVG